MARIYVGRTTGIGSFERHVVLKLILPERADDEVSVQMFLDEARLAASLNHQNVAQVFEVGEEQGIHYLAMEYVHGQDLRAVLAKAGNDGVRIPLELSLTVVAGAAAGLHHAHDRRGPDGAPLGIVHRDVSPSNIMIGYDGAVKLLDFGIAALADDAQAAAAYSPGWASPEQLTGAPVGPASDQYQLQGEAFSRAVRGELRALRRALNQLWGIDLEAVEKSRRTHVKYGLRYGGAFALALFSALLVTLMLSWGHNYMPLTDFFLDHVPGYSKFRAVTIILVIVELAAPVLAGMMFWYALRPPRQSFLDGPSCVGCVAVAACTVVMRPSSRPKLS